MLNSVHSLFYVVYITVIFNADSCVIYNVNISFSASGCWNLLDSYNFLQCLQHGSGYFVPVFL